MTYQIYLTICIAKRKSNRQAGAVEAVGDRLASTFGRFVRRLGSNRQTSFLLPLAALQPVCCLADRSVDG
jgi:hypothetical protein